jgi:hypothetical protein
MVTIEFSDDRSIPLTPDSAPRYAMTILQAVARAEYDAAVYRQLHDLINNEAAVVGLIRDLRQDRPEIDHAATAPLTVEPGVNRKGQPMLTVSVDGQALGQWTMEGAREHVLTALEVTAVADLDAGYYRALTGSVGIDEGRARAVIADLNNHRLEGTK